MPQNFRNPVGWFEIYVQDIPRAVKFYEAVFATRLQKLDSPTVGLEMWAFPMQEHGKGAIGALVKMDGCPSGDGGTRVYFSCVDCAVESKRAQANGGQLVREKFSIGNYGFIAFVNDSEGNTIGLHSTV